jgi:hypothetical protein
LKVRPWMKHVTECQTLSNRSHLTPSNLDLIWSWGRWMQGGKDLFRFYFASDELGNKRGLLQRNRCNMFHPLWSLQGCEYHWAVCFRIQFWGWRLHWCSEWMHFFPQAMLSRCTRALWLGHDMIQKGGDHFDVYYDVSLLYRCLLTMMRKLDKLLKERYWKSRKPFDSSGFHPVAFQVLTTGPMDGHAVSVEHPSTLNHTNYRN